MIVAGHMEKVINSPNGPPNPLGGPLFSVCGQICGQGINVHDRQAKKVVEIANFEEISELFAGINLLISMGHYLR